MRDIRRRIAGDPFLKLGIAAMALALGFAAVVGFFAFLERSQRAVAAKSSAEESASKPLVRSDPGVEPWRERDITAPQTTEEYGSPQPEPTQSEPPQPESTTAHDGDSSTLPLQEDGYPLPTEEQIDATDQPRRYTLWPGAIMSLTIPSLGLENAPVMDSVTRSALNKGVVHLPNASLPWSDTPERNVYLAGHRLGWPGTGSHLIFYHLNELTGGKRSPFEVQKARGTITRCWEASSSDPGQLGNGKGEGSRPPEPADVHAPPHLPEPSHRPRGADLAL